MVGSPIPPEIGISFSGVITLNAAPALKVWECACVRMKRMRMNKENVFFMILIFKLIFYELYISNYFPVSKEELGKVLFGDLGASFSIQIYRS